MTPDASFALIFPIFPRGRGHPRLLSGVENGKSNMENIYTSSTPIAIGGTYSAISLSIEYFHFPFNIFHVRFSIYPLSKGQPR